MNKTKLQQLRGFQYEVMVNPIMGTFQIVEKDTDKVSDVMDDIDFYKQLKKASRKGRKSLDDACMEVMG